MRPDELQATGTLFDLPASSPENGDMTERLAPGHSVATPATNGGKGPAPDGTVVTAGISPGPDSREPVLVLARTGGVPERVDIAKIPGAVEAQVAVNAVAARRIKRCAAR